MTPAPPILDGRELAPSRIAQSVVGHITRRPHAVIVDLGPAADATDLAVIAASLGDIADTARDTLVRGVEVLVPAADRTIDGVALTERLHTDGADRRAPYRYTCLLCLRPDATAEGRSLLCDASTFVGVSEAIAGGTDLLGCDLPWKLAAEDGGGTLWAPPVDAVTGALRWLDPDVALDHREVALTRRPALGRVAGALEATARSAAYDVLLGQGQLLVVDNKRCLHARTPIDAPASSLRLMARARVH